MTPPPHTLFAAFCGTCGAFVGASTTEMVAKSWCPGQCIPSHGRKPVAVAKYVLAPTPKTTKRKR